MQDTQTRYKTLIAATKVVRAAKMEAWQADEASPAWDKLRHADAYLLKQAGYVMDGLTEDGMTLDGAR